jgi:ATP phosphoribosyltransferase
MSQPVLKLGLPKGSLEEPTLALFGKSGWKIAMRNRNYFPEINDEEMAVSLCRPQEMPLYVADGILDAGLTGKDWVLENKADVHIVTDLVYSKMSNRPARWVLAVGGDSPYMKPEDLAGKRIATEIMGLTQSYFADRNIPVKVSYSWGATEAKVVEGLVDAIVEVTETGATIRAHGLRILDEVLLTNTQFIAGKEAWADPWKRRKIEQITMLLQGALRAESMAGLKMNAPTANLEAILKLVPSLNSPTISNLQDQSWVSLEIIVDTGLVRDLIPRLVEAGAEGIIEYPLNKVI